MNIIKKYIQKIFFKFFPELLFSSNKNYDSGLFKNIISDSSIIDSTVKLYSRYRVMDSNIDAYTYVSENSAINKTTIGKFCSIGPNFRSGSGMHPVNGISTSPIFYSAENRSLGFSLCTETKFNELDRVKIGNDVFIGANVVVMNGISIGDGAIIGAGAVVSKNIPPYAIALGCPIKIVKFRFDEPTIERLLSIKWWDRNIDDLKVLEENFYDVEQILKHFES